MFYSPSRHPRSIFKMLLLYIYIYIYVLSSMVTHTRNWSSAFNPSKCTHTAVSSEHAPRAVGSHCSSAQGAIGGSVPCSRAPQSWYWRWRECCSFTIPTFNPCRTWDSNPQPLDYKSDSLTIRPRLPHQAYSLASLFTGAKEAKFPYFTKGKPVSSWLISKSSYILLYKSTFCISNSWPAFCFAVSHPCLGVRH